jgi:hypothetical protein
MLWPDTLGLGDRLVVRHAQVGKTFSGNVVGVADEYLVPEPVCCLLWDGMWGRKLSNVHSCHLGEQYAPTCLANSNNLNKMTFTESYRNGNRLRDR